LLKTKIGSTENYNNSEQRSKIIFTETKYRNNGVKQKILQNSNESKQISGPYHIVRQSINKYTVDYPSSDSAISDNDNDIDDLLKHKKSKPKVYVYVC
jgi:hypothetical protein